MKVELGLPLNVCSVAEHGTEKNTLFARVIWALFFILAAEKSVYVKYADFLCRSWSRFYSSIIENTVRFVNILL